MKQRALPRSLADLRGLRAARWIRESTAGQVDRFGPDSQRDQQDSAIARYGLEDTGLAWLVAHSGRTIATTGSFAEMLAAAGERYDVLVVGYVSRFARDLETAVTARKALHQSGAAILFADERILTSDEDAWESWAREAVEAEAYSRRLGKRIREGYAAKFRREADQGGNAPRGFRRVGPSHTLEVDPATIGEVLAIFERYASGTVSLRHLAKETGDMIGHLAELLKNPVYNGWVSRRGQRAAAAWRSSPPVSDALWERVAQLRGRRAMRRGRPTSEPDPLRHLVFCACGATVRAYGVGRDGRRRRAHPVDRPCAEWGDQLIYAAATWLDPLEAQVRGIRLDDTTIAAVVAALRQPETPAIPIARGRLDRERRELALEHAAGRLTDPEYLAAAACLRQLALEEAATPATVDVDAARAVDWLRNLGATWDRRMDAQDRAELLAAVYDRVEVRGPEFVGVTLTDAAYRHGLALALPERVRVRVEMVSPEGARRTVSTRIPIVGRDAWLRASRIRSAG